MASVSRDRVPYMGIISPRGAWYWPPTWHWPQPSLRVSPAWVTTSSAQAVMAKEPGLGQGRLSLPMAKSLASRPSKPQTLSWSVVKKR